MPLLIKNKLCRLDKRNNHNFNPMPIKLGFERLHLAEMRATRQSCKVPEKNQKHIVAEAFQKVDCVAAQIEQRQLLKGDLFHESNGPDFDLATVEGLAGGNKKRGAPT